MDHGARIVLVTGWSGFIGRRLVHRLGEQLDQGRDRLVLLTRTRHLEEARAELLALGLQGEVLEGDVAKMHLGLSGTEYKRLTADVTEI